MYVCWWHTPYNLLAVAQETFLQEFLENLKLYYTYSNGCKSAMCVNLSCNKQHLVFATMVNQVLLHLYIYTTCNNIMT